MSINDNLQAKSKIGINIIKEKQWAQMITHKLKDKYNKLDYIKVISTDGNSQAISEIVINIREVKLKAVKISNNLHPKSNMS